MSKNLYFKEAKVRIIRVIMKLNGVISVFNFSVIKTILKKSGINAEITRRRKRSFFIPLYLRECLIRRIFASVTHIKV